VGRHFHFPQLTNPVFELLSKPHFRSKEALQTLKRVLGALGLLVSSVCLAGQPALAATPPSPSPQPVLQAATVTITDSGVTPDYVLITVGGFVTWQNNGSLVHTATTQGNAPLPMDTGGIGPGQSAVLQFSTPGTYWYNSETDCEGGVPNHGFNCGPYAIGVTTAPPTVANPSPPPLPATPPYTPAPISTVTSTTSTATPLIVTITDQGFVPPVVNVPVNGSVTWVNNGLNLHTVDSRGGAPASFDSGGMPHGAVFSFSFYLPGVYSYTSSPDCLQGTPPTPSFVCGSFEVIVGSPPPSPAPVAAATGTATVTIDDVNGFSPKSLTIKAGQTVTWTNNGSQVHSVVSDKDPMTGLPMQPAIDSGGLGPNQSFSYTFTQPGTLTYHSSTDVVWGNPDKYGFPLPTYTMTGTVTVQ
jgi:plastocyanin